MKRLITSTGIAAALLLLTFSLTTAAPMRQETPPNMMTYQGHLLNEVGEPVADGNYAMEFSFYDAPTDGSLLWGPEYHLVAVDDGYFAVVLGNDEEITAESLATFTYLEITVADETMTPRHQLTAVPFALVAGECISGTGGGGGSAEGAWLLAGNTGATTATLGTLDGNPVRIVVSGTTALEIAWVDCPGSGTTCVNIIGGVDHTIDGAVFATVSGGYANTVASFFSTIGGGYSNTVSGDYAVVSGGYSNTVSSDYAVVSGGDLNESGGQAAVIGGGTANATTAQYAVVGGGNSNEVDAYGATVSGGVDSSATGAWSTVGGGDFNRVSGDCAVIGGGSTISVSGDCATVGGGYLNVASGDYTTVGGGEGNDASGMHATVGGGESNTANNYHATVSGGHTNEASGEHSTVGGGYMNTASGTFATIPGGRDNAASALYATVSGGRYNVASGQYSTVGGGESNTAYGLYSFAAGRQATANHNGAFVWGDSTNAAVTSTAANQFIIRASGGVTMYTNSGLSSGATLPAGSGSWASLSDRDAKTGIEPVDASAILAALAGLDVSEWSYNASPNVRHVGPMAQDFYASFGYGDSERYISSVDADGVALAAIQALLARVEALEARVAELEEAQCTCP